jgi:hypothetical protein
MYSISPGHKPINYYAVHKHSAVSIVNGPEAGLSRSCGSISNRSKRFLLSKTSRPFVQPAHSLIQCATEALSPRVILPEGETEHPLHLVPRLMMHGAMSLIPYMPSRPTPEQLTKRQAFASCYSIDPAIIKSTVFHIILKIRLMRFSYLYTSWKTARAVIIMCYHWQSVPCWQIRKRSIHSIHLFYVNNDVKKR